jgi:bacterioferritin
VLIAVAVTQGVILFLQRVSHSHDCREIQRAFTLHVAANAASSRVTTMPQSAKQPKPAPATQSLSTIAALRDRARRHVQDGAVTAGYGADRNAVLGLLNQALATELVCVLRYRRHYFMASGAVGEAIKKEFLQHAEEEQAHADQLAERIVQLGGEPDLNPASLVGRSHSEYVEGKNLSDMLKEDLIAERIAIESYGEMIRFVGDGDPTTRRMLEGILANEEEHAEELASMLATLSGDSR